MTFMCNFFICDCLNFRKFQYGIFLAFFHGGHIENGYFDNITCDMLLATYFIGKRIKIYRKKLISESPVGVFIGYFYIPG